MKAVAERGEQVLVDLGAGRGAIYDRETEMLGQPMNILSLWSRGYWEPVAEGATVLKYDPSQPRDERGRWTSEGGGEGPEGVPAGHEAAWRRVLHDLNDDFPTSPGGPGNCYEAAFTLMMARDELGLKNVRVIQATCKGQGAIAGRLFGHSWIEADGDTVSGLGDGTRSMTMRNAYDFSSRKETVLPVALYRYFGQARDIHEYEPLEAMKQVVEHEHYGPWEPTDEDVL